MRYAFLLIFCFAVASFAQSPVDEKYTGTIVLTDGVNLVPNSIIPTPAEVEAVRVKAALAYDAAAVVYSSSVIVAGQANDLEMKTSALNGTQIVYGSCIAFGSQAIEVNTNATAMIIAQEFPSNTVDQVFINIYVHYTETLKAPPVVEVASNLITPTWAGAATLESELTTYPVAGVPVECYRILVSFEGSITKLYMRTKGELQESVIGQFNILENLTINGVRGKDEVNDIGTFKYGLLVEELDMNLFGEGATE